jgi:hypothetical protein
MPRPKLPPKRIKVVSEQRKKMPLKDEMISMRLTKAQLERLDFYRKMLETQMGLPVTRGWVVGRLMEMGQPSFEKFYDIIGLFKESESKDEAV